MSEVGLGLDAQELTADLVPRFGIAFEQKGRVSGLCQDAGRRGSGKPPAYDHDLLGAETVHFNRLTQRRNATCHWIRAIAGSIPAAWRMRSQSSRLKLRAMETGPSCCTNRCHRAARDRSWKK